MNSITLTINGKIIETSSDKNILQVLIENNIEIPHLCFDDRLKKQNATCGLCAIKLTNENILVNSCETPVKNGMVIETDNHELDDYRKDRLEELLKAHDADCVAPCIKKCPANIDIQSSLKHLSVGNFDLALQIIKEKNPFPLITGLVCHNICESECRRTLVEEPVAIKELEKFLGEKNVFNGKYSTVKKHFSGKKIVVVGSGPSGLTAAYYSALNGHDVTIFEKEKEAGGMLRYGIPDFRLPKEILKKEIENLKNIGIKIETGKKLGIDFQLESLRKDFDAVYLAPGMSKPNRLNIEGENSTGVFNGLDYLYKISNKAEINHGNKVLIIGNGNTAIDCARTSLKFAKNVTVISSTRNNEMSADASQIKEAVSEGVKIFFNLIPFKIKEKNGTKNICFINIADKKSHTNLEADTIIVAIGQTFDNEQLNLELNEKNHLKINGKTMQTPLENVFAGGDAVTGTSTVIHAIAAGYRAAESMNDFINTGTVIEKEETFAASRGSLEEIPGEDFDNILPDPRKKINSKHDAVEEAIRCLQCGCSKSKICSLRKTATKHKIKHKLSEHSYKTVEKNHSFIVRNPNKCISCGRCVSVCKEWIGSNALTIKENKIDFKSDQSCLSCGHCINSCPCGALSYSKEIFNIIRAINDPDTILSVSVTPAVRSVIANKLGVEYENAMPKLIGILRTIGFDRVFDFGFATGLGVMEESLEFLRKVKENETLPHLITSCPAFVNLIENSNPELIPFLSKCKSPQQIMGTTIRNHYPKWAKTDKKMFIVSIISCLGKKDESAKVINEDGSKDVDAVLTTNELFEMIEMFKVDVKNIIQGEYDPPYIGKNSGILLGVSGGVAEAAIKYISGKILGEPVTKNIFSDSLEYPGVREAILDFNGKNINVAVINGLKNVEKILSELKEKKELKYHLIEIMACPGGCVSGSGNPQIKNIKEMSLRKETLVETFKQLNNSLTDTSEKFQKIYEECYENKDSGISKKYLKRSFTAKNINKN